MTLAVDFGTSNTVIARWNAATQQPELISLGDFSYRTGANPPLVPSLLYVQQPTLEGVVLGQQVRDRGLDIATDNRFFRNFKRGIGTPLQGFMPQIDGQTLSFEQVGQWFLTRVIQSALATVEAESTLVFTVPVDSFEAYRHWLGQVCASLAIQQVKMIDEPTAAALGYGLSGGQTLLVVDFGGGTLDFSLVRLESQPGQKPLGFLLKWGSRNLAESSSQRAQTAAVLAKAGENLGGADLDHWLAEYFHAQQGMPISALTLRLAERLKIQLSSQNEATEVYFNDETLETFELKLDRATFEEILRQNQFFDRLDERLSQVMQQARRQGIEAADIDAVLLVGGTAQIPAVQAWLKNAFDPERVRCDRPFEAVAQGALQLAQGLEVKDFLYHSYGIRYWDRRQQHHSWHPIVERGQPYPMSAPVEITLGASAEKQPSIELIVGEIGNEGVKTEVYFEGDRLVTRQTSGGKTQVQPLNDKEGARTIAQLSPPGFPGSDRIKAQFWVDTDRFLRITVEDLLTGDTLMANQAVVRLQ